MGTRSQAARNKNNNGNKESPQGANGRKAGKDTPSANSSKKSRRKQTPAQNSSTKGRRNNNAKVQTQLNTVKKNKPGNRSKPKDNSEESKSNIKEETKQSTGEKGGNKNENPRAHLEEVKENLFDKQQQKEDNKEAEVGNEENNEGTDESNKEGTAESEEEKEETDATVQKESNDNGSSDSPESTNESNTDEIKGDKRKKEGKPNDLDRKKSAVEEEDIEYHNILTDSPPTKFKKVDCYSANRRECVRAKYERERSTTPEKSNKSKFRNEYYSRVTIKVTIPPSTKPHEAFCSTMGEYFKELFQADEKLQILPWKSLSTSTVLNSKSELPVSITGMMKYCFRAYTPKEGVPATIYPQLFIGHDSEFEDLRESLQPWLDAKLFGIYYNMLQAEDAKDIGWLLYSTREMDTGALVDEIVDIIGCNIGLRWKNIQNGTKTSKENMVKALIVETSAKNKWKVQRELIHLYSRAIKPPRAYPNSIRMRYVKFKKDAVNKEEKSKIDKLRSRQKQFLEGIKQYVTNDIVQLDYSSNPGRDPTLRQMILELKHSESGNPLFHTVDMDWRQDGFIFQYSSANSEEAETTIHTLLTILEHHYPEIDVTEYFSEEAIENNEDMYWDEDRKCAVDSKTNETGEFQQDEELPGFIFDQEALNELNREVGRAVMPEDSDSISTFRQAKSPARSTNTAVNQSSYSGLGVARVPSSAASTGTTLTTESYATLDSRITGLASQMMSNQAKTEKQMEKQQQQFNTIMESLHRLNQNNNSSSTKEASSPNQTGNEQ